MPQPSHLKKVMKHFEKYKLDIRKELFSLLDAITFLRQATNCMNRFRRDELRSKWLGKNSQVDPTVLGE